jgi:FtsP/CotA-like multicopper oxidase with cupredoxin domain
MRSDLNDPHTVHFHGFPQAAAVFDGLPEVAISINMMSSLTYYYQIVHPGTYMWHCHVEAVEHMQMGMLGQLYVRPAQNRLPDGTDLKGFTHQTGYKYVHNDGDGSTYYDVEYPLQLGSFDQFFHEMDETFQPPPFFSLHDNYPMINGRGYPDTVNPSPLAAPVNNGGKVSQPMSSLVTVPQGKKLLLRLSNLNITRFYTVQTTGLPMKIVAKDARLLRGPTGLNQYYTTYSFTSGGGESTDAIIDTTDIPKGTYYLYATNLNYLSNNQEDFGGMMTEILIQ